jgi:KDO2-lipid IV(A) lauroyltransferase
MQNQHNRKKKMSFADYMQSAMALVSFRILQNLPISVGSAFGAFTGHLYAVYGDWRGQLWFKRLKRNLAFVTGEDDPRKIAKKSYQLVRNSGRVTAEFPAMDPAKHANRLNIIGGHFIDQLKGPIVIASCHIANWETSGASLVLRGIPITGIYIPPTNDTVHRLALEARHRLLAGAPGSRLIDASENAAKKFLRAAWQRENMQIFVDEEKDGLIWCPPLGRKLPDSGNRFMVAMLAVKCDYQILPVHVRRRKGVWFDLIIEEPLKIEKTGDEKADIQRIGDQIAEMAERWVKETPEQWYWMADLNLDKKFPK